MRNNFVNINFSYFKYILFFFTKLLTLMKLHQIIFHLFWSFILKNTKNTYEHFILYLYIYSS